jgi:hypothetical protein
LTLTLSPLLPAQAASVKATDITSRMEISFFNLTPPFLEARFHDFPVDLIFVNLAPLKTAALAASQNGVFQLLQQWCQDDAGFGQSAHKIANPR